MEFISNDLYSEHDSKIIILPFSSKHWPLFTYSWPVLTSSIHRSTPANYSDLIYRKSWNHKYYISNKFNSINHDTTKISWFLWSVESSILSIINITVVSTSLIRLFSLINGLILTILYLRPLEIIWSF